MNPPILHPGRPALRPVVVPEQILTALARRQGRYTDMKSVFHCICVDNDHWVGVAGDGDNASYEQFSFHNGQLTCSDSGYGDSVLALRDILNAEVK